MAKQAARDCIQNRYADLTNSIKAASPTVFGNELVQVKMISEDTMDFEGSSNKYDQASKIMGVVSSTVQVDPESINKFIKVLCESNDPGCRKHGEDMKKEMERATSGRKELGGMGSSYSGMEPMDQEGQQQQPPVIPMETGLEQVDNPTGLIERAKNVYSALRGHPRDHADGTTNQDEKMNGQKVDHPERFYKMGGRSQHGRHGIALIINNIKWQEDERGIPYMSARHGASDSATALKKSLEKIGYTVEPKENLKSTQMKVELERASSKIVSADDSFICYISTHGDEDGVYGVDGRPRTRKLKSDGTPEPDTRTPEQKPVPIEAFSKILEPDMCKHLSQKPKIFFIQACRGGKPSEPTDDPNEKGLPVPPRLNVVPRGADYYFSYATDPGHLALRADYPKYLSEYLSEDLLNKFSLDEIVMNVHAMLASRVADVNQGEHLQIGQVVHTMRGPVYFQ